jgi:hypothetical protein
MDAFSNSPMDLAALEIDEGSEPVKNTCHWASFASCGYVHFVFVPGFIGIWVLSGG